MQSYLSLIAAPVGGWRYRHRMAWCWWDGAEWRQTERGVVETIPAACPRCGVAWSTPDRMLILRENAVRSWGAPPDGSTTATVFYECLHCPQLVYVRRR
ncbi:hypothetical protein GM1_041_00440 [Gordonia malaquae NBRC 108250]|uniref:Uncharacterized protein n=2 Tax=Gordonia malaquae TaxID=410332 RepID=M3VCA5_GORML|nr:hypothetical protein GM1_041_00440 [Gordonia malaquae NBRC 108250]